MKKFLFLLILLLPFTTHSQWLPTHGPEGGEVKCLTAEGIHMYAGTLNSGVYLSVDSGNSWQAVNNGLLCMHVQAMATLDSIVFAGTTQGVFRSDDYGNSWTQLNIGPVWVWSMAVNDNDVMVGLENGGLQLSHDTGTTWLPFVGGSVHAIIGNGQIIYAGSYTHMSVSLDHGQTWNYVDNGLPFNLAVNAIEFFGPDVIASVGGQIYMTSDTGQNWILKNSGISHNVFDLAVKGNKLFAASFGDGIYSSIDSGTTWNLVNVDPNNKWVNDFLVVGNDLWAGVVRGINKSTNDGVNWQMHNHQLNISTVQSIAWLGSRMFAASTDAGMNVSDDNGNTWTVKDSGIYNTNGTLITVGSNVLYGTEAGVFLTADSGELWTPVNSGLSPPDVECLIVMGNKVFAGTNGDGPYVSNDQGYTWSPANAGLEGSYTLAMLSFGPELYVSLIDSGILKSVDSGLTWVPVNNGLPTNYVVSLATDGINIYAAGGAIGDLYISSNHGASWTPLNPGSLTSYFQSLSVINSVVFACTNGDGIIYSADQGANWASFNNGLGSLNVSCIVQHSQDLFAGTGNMGVFINSNIPTGIREKKDFSSLSIYPNPATEYFTLQLNGITSDKISIFDVTGRVVFEVKSDQLKFSSKTDIYFNAPAGVYFVKCGDSVSKLIVE